MGEGDILGSIKLDIADVTHKLNQVQQAMNNTLGQINQKFQSTTKDMSSTSENFAHVARGHAKTFSLEWWRRFGEIAVGFSIAYRAMNAIENVIYKVANTIGDAIKESSELAEVQAKLAFWYTLHTEKLTSYSEALDRASVNTRALREANVTSISTMSELSTGIDEISQSVGAVPAKLVPALADMVDFTVMVAQTTGSTLRQVRQEFQALMEGRIRTTDVMARSLIKTGILTKDEIKQMREMRNQAEILNKVLTALSERWAEAREEIVRSSVELAKGRFEKSMRLPIMYASELASKMQGVRNIFAEVFYQHAQKNIAESTEKLSRYVLTVQFLASVLDKALTIYEVMMSLISKGIGFIYSFAQELSAVLKVMIALFITTHINSLLLTFSRILIAIVSSPIKLAIKALLSLAAAFRILNSAILIVPATAYLVTVAFMSLFKTLSSSYDKMVSDLKRFFSDIPEFLKWAIETLGSTLKELWGKIWESLPEPIRDFIDAIGTIFSAAASLIKERMPEINNIGSEFVKNFKGIVKGNIDSLSGLLKGFYSMISSGNDETFKKMLKDTEEYLEGLDWAFGKAGEEDEKAMKARLRRERQLLRLLRQMNKDFIENKFEETMQGLDDEFIERIARIQELTDKEEAHNKEAWDKYNSIINEGLLERNFLEKRALDARAQMIRELLLDELAYTSREYYDKLVENTEKTFWKMLLLGAKYEEAETWRLNRLKEINRDYYEAIYENSHSYIEVFVAKMRSAALELKNDFQLMADFLEGIFKDLKTSTGDLFYNALRYQILSFQDFFVSFTDSLARRWADTLAEMLINWIETQAAMLASSASSGKGMLGTIFKAVAGIFTGGLSSGAEAFVPAAVTPDFGVSFLSPNDFLVPSFHMGRIMTDSLPRFHDGLMPGEFPAILKNDESVLTPEQLKALTTGDNYTFQIYAMDSKSFSDFTKRNPSAIVGPVINQISGNNKTLINSLRKATGGK